MAWQVLGRALQLEYLSCSQQTEQVLLLVHNRLLSFLRDLKHRDWTQEAGLSQEFEELSRLGLSAVESLALHHLQNAFFLPDEEVIVVRLKTF